MVKSKDRVLIIGGGGYVGTVLSSHFLKQNYQVVVLDDFVYNNQFAVSAFLGDKDFELIKGDMADSSVLEKVAKGVTQVVILAGLVGDPITKKFPQASARINDAGVTKCIDFFETRDIDKLVFVSTCSNYGLIKENELAHEDFPLNPLSLYAKSKVAAEKHLLSKKGKVGYSGVILRFATAFGLSPRMRFDLTISEFTRDLVTGHELVVFDEHTWRPYCHVRDFATLINKVIEAPRDDVYFEVFNAGGDANNFTKKMIVDTILKKVPEGKVSYNQKGSDPRNYRVSFEKVRNILDFTPERSVEMGIDELANALLFGLYADSVGNKERYGNFEINNP